MLSCRTFLRTGTESVLAPTGIGQSACANAEAALRAHRIAWLEAHAAPLRSLDPDDSDFADLEPFAKAVGNARIVMLGEQSHGAGATFLAKTRLIRFLHERMDFDVLAFESPLYEVHKVWQLLLAGKDVGKTVKGGIYTAWSQSAQARPLFDYIGERLRSGRPLELAGFDFRGPFADAVHALVADLLAFLGTHGVEAPAIIDWPRFRSTIEKLRDTEAGDPWRPGPEENRFVEEALQRLSESFATATDRDAMFWRQVLRTLKARTNDRFQKGGTDYWGDTVESISRRDCQMASNLIWLAHEAYPARKIIVWAATFHTMRNPQEIMAPRDLVPAEFVSMGHWAWQALGPDIFSVAFTSYQGDHSFFYEETTHAIEPPPAGSLEGLWAGTSQQNAFLDLRPAADGADWLRAPLESRIVSEDDPARADWTRIVDAIVFIRTMTRSTPVT